jgi:Flp pilus assembly protein TadD
MDERLNQAAQLRLEGDLAAALQLCDAMLAEAPDAGLALSLSSACLAELGEVEEAGKRIARARKAAGDQPRILLDASVVHEAAGDLEAALAAARKATEIDPEMFAAWGRRGDLAGRSGDMADAARSLTRALAIEPNHDGVRLLLAGACLVTGEMKTAHKAFAGMSKPAKASEEGLRLLLALVHHDGDWPRLVDAAEALLQVLPGDSEAIRTLAHALGQQGFFQKAARTLQPLAEANPDDAELWVMMGRFNLGARRFGKARFAFARALDLNGGEAEARNGLARIATIKGDLDEAEALCRDLVARDPSHVQAWGQLVEVTRGKLGPKETETLVVLASRTDLPNEERAAANFALGEVRHRQGEPDLAYQAWSTANALRSQLNAADKQPYDPAKQDQIVDRLIEGFDGAAYGEPAVAGISGPTPLFIVGMPRSGTTLVESILAAHPEIAGAGELPMGLVIHKEFLAWAETEGWRGGPIPSAVLDGWRRRYLDQYRFFGLDTSARIIADKQPANVFAVGLLRQLFPDAPIIHIRRNPVETGFSIFRRNFSREWAFADRQVDIAHQYAAYARIVAHWHAVFGRSILHVQYEDLVADFKQGARRIVGASRLHFDRACLEYWKVDREVVTFSAAQVRKPPSLDHLDQTTPYRVHLSEMIEVLEAHGVNLETGALKACRADPQAEPGRKSIWRRLGLTS